MRKLPDCTVVNVSASQDLRFTWTQRSTTKRKLPVPTREKFLSLDNQECEVDIDEIAKQADFTIRNDRDDPFLTHLVPQVEMLVRGLTM